MNTPTNGRLFATVLALATLSGCSDDALIADAASFQELTLVERQGGLAPPPCESHEAQRTTTITANPYRLTWDYCDGAFAPLPEKQITGTRELSAEEVNAIIASLEQITPSEGQCGADGSLLKLDVRTPHSHGRYVDDWVAGCPGADNEGRVVTTGISALAQVLRGLAPGE